MDSRACPALAGLRGCARGPQTTRPLRNPSHTLGNPSLAFNPKGPLLFLAMHQVCYTSSHVTLPEPSVAAEQAHKEGGGRHAHFQVGNVNVMAALHKPPLLNLQVLLSPCS